VKETLEGRWTAAGKAALVPERRSLPEAMAQSPARAMAPGRHAPLLPLQEPAYDVVIFYPCSILPEMDGAQSRVGEMLDRLSAELHSIAFYSFDDDPQHPWTSDKRAMFAERWPGVDLVTEPQGKSVKWLSYVKKVLLGLFPLKARRILSLRVKSGTPALARLSEATCVFVVNYQKGLCELNGIDPAICFVETHDLHFLKTAKVHSRSPFSASLLLKLRAELGSYATVRAVFAISPGETTFFRMLLPDTPTYFISAWTSPTPRLPAPQAAADFDFVFVGSAYQMNARGLCALYETDGSWLSRYRVAICGKVCDDPAVKSLAAKWGTISLLGYVDDLNDVFRRSRAALSPVSGTGVKMKILAAVRAGLPVFASRNSMEGLAPGYDGAVMEIEEEACRRMLVDTAAYDSACRAAVAYGMAYSRAGEADAAIAAIKQTIARTKTLT
jgi:hypothetical protein